MPYVNISEVVIAHDTTVTRLYYTAQYVSFYLLTISNKAGEKFHNALIKM